MSVRPPEEWCPRFTQFFSDEEIVRETYAVSVFNGGCYCKLCDSWFTGSAAEHVAIHAEDLAVWREVRRAEQARVRAERLAEAKKDHATVPVSAGGLTAKQLVSRIRNAKWKLAHPERHKKDAWSDAERTALEATINEAQKALGRLDGVRG